jgi:uncharacterized membrane-anchored protein YhcB (DUF1043 family)
MKMVAFLTAWGTEIIFSLTGIIIGLIVKHYFKKTAQQLEDYKTLLEEKETQEIEN